MAELLVLLNSGSVYRGLYINNRMVLKSSPDFLKIDTFALPPCSRGEELSGSVFYSIPSNPDPLTFKRDTGFMTLSIQSYMDCF